ncbi:TraV family lipoprotein [Neisseria sicca]|uniref:TraV family lipoprotein n=1 Tax=Neisseria sicca TaxID=490 RepID=UPI000D31B32E|nr:TraV family lipoprotein [Neisseria sicca]
MTKNTVSSVLAALLLAGCAASMNTGSGKLGCGRAKQGACMNMAQAWDASDDYRPGEYPAAGGLGSSKITPFLPEPIPNAATVYEPKPLLMPAQVLRVWVNAYEDSSGSLVYPTRVFSEVTPRRWNVGYSAMQAIESSRTVTPLVAPAADGTAQRAGGQGAAVSEGSAVATTEENDSVETAPQAQPDNAQRPSENTNTQDSGGSPAQRQPESLPAGALPAPLQ